MKSVLIDLGPTSCPAPGTARFVTEQARALLSMSVDWNWKVVLESRDNPLFEEFSHFQPIIIPGTSQSRRQTFSLTPLAMKSDLSFSTACFVPILGNPVVANFFDSNLYEHFHTWVASGRLLNALLVRTLADFCIFRSSKLFVLSEYCANYLRLRFPSAASKFVVAPPGCAPPSSNSTGHFPQWANRLKSPFLLYVGTFSENKNQRRLIDAYCQYQRQTPSALPLVIIGPSPNDYLRNTIQPAIGRSPHPENIIIPGRVIEADLVWAYHHALAYIQPSIGEGFGMPVIEAMSYGLPVSCSNTTSLPETAGGAAHLFDPFSVSSIANALHAVAFDAVLRAKLKTLGDARWRLFTWEANAKLVASEIEQVLRRL